MTQSDGRMASRMRTLTRVLAGVLVVALVVPFVIYAVPGVVGAEASYVVLTASMTPDIAPGDVVVVDAVDAGSVEVGDVITFRPRSGDGIPVTHRVVGIETTPDGERRFLTKGDANEEVDTSSVASTQVVGRVWFVIPVVGHVVQFVGTPAGFVALVVVPIGLLVATELVSVVRHGRRDDGSAGDTTSAAGDPAAFGGFDPAVVVDDETTVSDDADDSVTLSPTDLTMTSLALGAFVLYAGYAAYQRPSGLSVGVAVAVGATFALALGLRQFGATAPVMADGGVSVGASTAIADVTVTGRGADSDARVAVDSLAALHTVAAVLGHPVVHDRDGTSLVLDGAVTYVYAADPADWMLAWARAHRRTSADAEVAR